MSLFDDLFGKPSPFSLHGAQGMTEEEIKARNLKLWSEHWERVGRETIKIADQYYGTTYTVPIKPKKWWQFWK